MNQPLSVPAPPASCFETARLVLRPFTSDDFSSVHAYASDEANTVYMLFDPNTEDDTRAYIRNAIAASTRSPVVQYEYAAVLKTTNEVIGGCGIHAEDIFEDGTAEVGWLVNRRFWRQGYGAEMGAFLLRLGFTQLGCHRIIARCDADNTASYSLMEKIGMRREGCFIEGRQGNRLQNYAKRDELRYAILADEWHTQQEVAYYGEYYNGSGTDAKCGDDVKSSSNAKYDNDVKSSNDAKYGNDVSRPEPEPEPVRFTGFINFDELPAPLTDGVLALVCVKKVPADPVKEHVPAYHFDIRLANANGERVGDINLRIGYVRGLYYGGHIGYNVDEAYRGNGYAVRACKLLTPVIKAHGMREVLITNDHANIASRRVCEKLGARLLRVARLPEWCDLYQESQRFSNIFAWRVD